MSLGSIGKALPILMIAALLSACSASEEIDGTDQQASQKDGTFERVDKQEEPIIPETEEPVTLEAVEDEDVPAVGKPVPVRTADSEPPAPPSSRQEPEQQQEAQPDTAPATAPRAGSMMWSVQLGAFKSEAGAFQLIEELKKKFNQPVYKRYDPASGYYKVTLGSYPTREAATEFKLDVQSRGYPDAFTVEVAR